MAIMCSSFFSTGCGWRNFDAGLLTGKGGLISILQEFYPERLFAV
jgi:hypothetical protein